MNSPTLETPPAPPEQTDRPEHWAVVKIALPDLPFFYPAGNTIAVEILHAFLHNQLLQKSLLASPEMMCCGPINNSLFLFRVSRLGPALAVLDEVLKEATLRDFASVAFYDGSELFFRNVGPDGAGIGARLTLESIGESIKAARAKLQAALGDMKQAIEIYRQLKALPADPENPAAPQT